MAFLRRAVEVCCVAGAGTLVGLAVPDLLARRRLCQVTRQLGAPGVAPADEPGRPSGPGRPPITAR